jgi:hypothetical protein
MIPLPISCDDQSWNIATSTFLFGTCVAESLKMLILKVCKTDGKDHSSSLHITAVRMDSTFRVTGCS